VGTETRINCHIIYVVAGLIMVNLLYQSPDISHFLLFNYSSSSSICLSGFTRSSLSSTFLFLIMPQSCITDYANEWLVKIVNCFGFGRKMSLQYKLIPL